MLAMQIETDESVISDIVTSRGLREVHVMRYGRPLTSDPKWAAKWLDALCPGHAREFATFFVRKEDDPSLPYYHLYIWWNAREMVTFPPGWGAPLTYGAMWYIPKGVGETVSYAADCAATIYRQATGRAPTMVWINNEPVNKRATVATQEGELAVITGAGWVPERYIMVGIPAEVWDPVCKGGRYE